MMMSGWKHVSWMTIFKMKFIPFLKGMNIEYQEVIVFTSTVFSLIFSVNFENLFHFFKK